MLNNHNVGNKNAISQTFRRIVQPGYSNAPDLYFLKSDRTRAFKFNEDEYKITQTEHHLGLVDWFVSLYLTGQLHSWQRYWTKEEWHANKISVIGVMPDAIYTLKDNVTWPFFDEYDRDNEPILSEDQLKRASQKTYEDSFNFKLDSYLKLSDVPPVISHTVTIHVEAFDKFTGEYSKELTLARCEAMIDLLTRYRRGSQFVVAVHRDLVGDREEVPGELHNELLGDALGKHWVSPLDPSTPLSLRDLIA